MAINEQEIMNGIFESAKAELSLDQMSAINGGTITSSEKSLLKKYLKMAKDAGVTKETVLSLIPKYYKLYHDQYPNVTEADVKNYVKSNWDKL